MCNFLISSASTGAAVLLNDATLALFILASKSAIFKLSNHKIKPFILSIIKFEPPIHAQTDKIILND